MGIFNEGESAMLINESKGYYRFLSVFFFLIGLMNLWGLFNAVQVSHIAVIIGMLFVLIVSAGMSVRFWKAANRISK